MGGGNGCKSAAKREKNAAKQAKAAKGGSQLQAQRTQAMRICKKCYTQYPMTAKEPELKAHCESKHADFGIDKAFPDFGKAEE